MAQSKPSIPNRIELSVEQIKAILACIHHVDECLNLNPISEKEISLVHEWLHLFIGESHEEGLHIDIESAE